MGKQYSFVKDGYAAGAEAAEHNISDRQARADLEKYIEKDRVGEFASEVREHQVQFEGDISYDVGTTVTERQYELWEEGFFRGFEDTVRKWFKEKLRR